MDGVRRAELLRVGPVDVPVRRALLGVEQVVIRLGSARDELGRVAKVRAERRDDSPAQFHRLADDARGLSERQARAPGIRVTAVTVRGGIRPCGISRSFRPLPRTVSCCRVRSKSRTRMPPSSPRRTPQSSSTSRARRSRGLRAQPSSRSSTSAGRSGAVFRGARGRLILDAVRRPRGLPSPPRPRRLGSRT